MELERGANQSETTHGKREKRNRNLIVESEEYLSPHERISKVEMLLGQRLHDIKVKRDKETQGPFLVTELDLTEQEIAWCFSCIKAVSDETAVDSLIEQFPTTFLASLVGAHQIHRSSSFWDFYGAATGIHNSNEFYRTLNRVLRSTLRKKGLSAFEREDLGNNQYIQLIRLHSGLSPHDVQVVMDGARSFLKDTRPVPENQTGEALFILAANGELGEDLELSARLTPQLIRSTFTLLAEMMELHSVDPLYLRSASFEAGSGVVEPTFVAAKEWIYNDLMLTPRKAEGALPNRPSIKLDSLNLRVELVLPRVDDADSDESIRWSITIDGKRNTVFQSVNPFDGTASEKAIPLYSTKLDVRAQSTDVKWHFPLTTRKRDRYWLFSERGALLANQDSFARSRFYLALAPDTEVLPDQNPRNEFSAQPIGQIEGWNGWRLFHVSTGRSRRFRLRTNQQVFELESRNEVAPLWDTNAGHQFLIGRDMQPVHVSSPIVYLPEDEGTWTFDFFLLTPDGNRHEVMSMQASESGELDVFPQMEHPWVGKYEVNISLNGAKVSSRVFNLAEGLSAQLTIAKGTGSSRFTVPTREGVSKKSRSHIYFETHHPSLRAPLDSQAVETGSGARSFCIHSIEDPDLYRLDVSARPPALQYRVDETSEQTQWRDSHETISIDDLDAAGILEISFPAEVHSPSLKLTTDQRLIKEIGLTRTPRKNVWRAPLGSIVYEAKKHPSLVVVADWFELSDKEYISRLASSYTRKRMREDLKLGISSNRSGALSPLFTVDRKPLLRAASLNGTTLSLSFHRRPSRGVECWVWPTNSVFAPGVRVEVDGTKATLPRHLENHSSLLVEVQETELLRKWTPTHPTSNARPISVTTHRPADAFPAWLYRPTFEDLSHDQMIQVWNARLRFADAFRIRHFESIEPLKNIERTTSNYISREPRKALERLSESEVGVSRIAEFTIRSGLVFQSFQSSKTSGQIHPEPLVGVLLEMNDIVTLQSDVIRSTDLSAELDESLKYIIRQGSSELSELLCGNTDVLKSFVGDLKPLNMPAGKGIPHGIETTYETQTDLTFSPETHVLIHEEIRRNQSRLNEVESLLVMLQAAEKRSSLFERLSSKNILLIENELRFQVQQSGVVVQSPWVATRYISFVFSFLARLEAHGFINYVPELDTLRPSWAEVALIAPRLASFDLTLAECTILGIKAGSAQ